MDVQIEILKAGLMIRKKESHIKAAMKSLLMQAAMILKIYH